VELGAIEAAVRDAVAGANAVALSWPPQAPSGHHVLLAVEAATADHDRVVALARESLPDYMVPARTFCLPSFPKNASGKADRKAIAAEVARLLEVERANTPLAGLTPVERALVQAIMAAAPFLRLADILQADNLLNAGMDSLGFVELTAQLETLFQLTLDQDSVVHLSTLSFRDMVAFIGPSQAPASKPTAAAATPSTASTASADNAASAAPNPRARRALEFIERFPHTLRTLDAPAVLAIGSSGLFRGLDAAAFDATLEAQGLRTRSLNIGLPAISCEGIARLCQFIVQHCQQAAHRPALVLYELDPMHISVSPPQGDLLLDERHLSGQIRLPPDRPADTEFTWTAAHQGTGQFMALPPQARQRPQWEQQREIVVGKTYLGEVPFHKPAIQHWLAGARALQALQVPVAVFVHPLEPAQLQALAQAPGARPKAFEQVLAAIAQASGWPILPWQGFALDTPDFLNINHVNPAPGRGKLSVQLARMCLQQGLLRAPSA
jgi:acyl carrier protein